MGLPKVETGAVSDCFACSSDPWLPTGLPCPAFICLVVSLLWEDCFFLKEKGRVDLGKREAGEEIGRSGGRKTEVRM